MRGVQVCQPEYTFCLSDVSMHTHSSHTYRPRRVRAPCIVSSTVARRIPPSFAGPEIWGGGTGWRFQPRPAWIAAPLEILRVRRGAQPPYVPLADRYPRPSPP